MSRPLPSTEQIVEKLKNPDFPYATQILADNGELIGEFYKQRRYVIPIEEIPHALYDALALGHDFWTSDFCMTPGIDTISVMRLIAALTKPYSCPYGPLIRWSARAFPLIRKGGVVQRMRQVLLFYRIEKAVSKEQMFYAYINGVYHGSGAFGVEAAARTYFGKNAKDLTIAECVMLAGLPVSPLKYSPKRNLEAALERRNYVLQRMWEAGKITQAQYDKAIHEKPTIVDKTISYGRGVTSFMEHVRKYISKKYGDDALYTGGLKVYTAVDLRRTKEAQRTICSEGYYLVSHACIKRIVDRHGKVLEEN